MMPALIAGGSIPVINKNIETHIENGGEVYGWGRAILAGLIGLILIVVLLFIFVYFSEN